MRRVTFSLSVKGREFKGVIVCNKYIVSSIYFAAVFCFSCFSVSEYRMRRVTFSLSVKGGEFKGIIHSMQ